MIGNSVYFGCEDGKLYSVSTVNGNIRWATQLGGPVKAAPAYKDGKLFVGDYGGYMNAVDAKTGKLVWQTGSLGTGDRRRRVLLDPGGRLRPRLRGQQRRPRLQLRHRQRRTRLDLLDRRLRLLGARPSPRTKHSPPTVYIGSFDGNIYALNAKDGTVRWSRSTGGQVVGSLSAIGEIVYVAEFTNQHTLGFMMHSGRRVFRYPKGTYTPIISDGQDLYLTGYSSITALAPIHPVKPAIGNAFVPVTEAQARRIIRLRRRRAAAAAGAARPARKPGTARRAAGP